MSLFEFLTDLREIWQGGEDSAKLSKDHSGGSPIQGEKPQKWPVSHSIPAFHRWRTWVV